MCSKDKEKINSEGQHRRNRVTGLITLSRSNHYVFEPSQPFCPAPFTSHIRKGICPVLPPLCALEVCIPYPISR